MIPRSNVQGLIRVRLTRDPLKSVLGVEVDNNQIKVKDTERGKEESFQFDKWFSPEVQQEGIFDLLKPKINAVLKGENVTVLAYGPSGSGKTHTMQGSRNDQGVIPRTLQAIFNAATNMDGEMAVSISYVEIYNEEIRDLLNDQKSITRLSIKTDGNGGFMTNGRQLDVASSKEFGRLFSSANIRRMTAATKLNRISSRSHVILTIHITRFNEGISSTSQLCMVDLAGSENSKKAETIGSTLKDASSINKSLLSLNMVVTALVTGTKPPFRDSLLTKMLQPALEGRSSIVLVCCVSPEMKHKNDTFNALRFSARMMQIKPILTQIKPADSGRRQGSDTDRCSLTISDTSSSEGSLPTSLAPARPVLKSKPVSCNTAVPFGTTTAYEAKATSKTIIYSDIENGKIVEREQENIEPRIALLKTISKEDRPARKRVTFSEIAHVRIFEGRARNRASPTTGNQEVQEEFTADDSSEEFAADDSSESEKSESSEDEIDALQNQVEGMSQKEKELWARSYLKQGRRKENENDDLGALQQYLKAESLLASHDRLSQRIAELRVRIYEASRINSNGKRSRELVEESSTNVQDSVLLSPSKRIRI